ncbi:YraN family protein [Advenella kashmirensis]
MTGKKPAELARDKRQPPAPMQSHQRIAFMLAANAQGRQRARQRRRAATGPSALRKTHEQRLSPSQLRGLQAESHAIAWLCGHGLQLLGTNLRCRYGELDAVFRADAQTMVIVEIRHRRNPRHGGAAGSITYAKQQRLRRTAAWFLPQLAASGFGGRTPRCRFDAVCIEGDTLNWLPAVF